ncbi:MAG TPA: potassium transporter Kup [Kineosporiaceae bacterium]|nr:potassium transporter Kup [Kineosporiaceae bacterium]
MSDTTTGGTSGEAGAPPAAPPAAPAPADAPAEAARARGSRRRGPVRSVSPALVVAALGVVFGDIGTSPLYALQTVFTIDQGAVRPTPEDVYGVISLMFWSVTLVVSVKYIGVVMRADNDGEGGVMALIALVRRLLGEGRSSARAIVALGVLGASLFYGDSLITPSISVLSAVEGLSIAAPGLEHLVLPIAVVILAGLFAVQRFGTGRVGAFFGPVMILWFGVLAVAGIGGITRHPEVVRGLSPTYGVAFVVAHPYIAFVAIGAVVLVITGAEALYADMGHFGRPAIGRAWFFFVFPALTLNYLGQAGLILDRPDAVANPFFLLLPSWARLPMVVLATLATVIASQAVISGAFSVSRQAMQLGFLPAQTIRQTSEHEGGQVYLPAVNGALFAGVLVLVLTFESSARLATAYGVAVTGALLIDTVLMLVVAKHLWHWQTWKLVVAGVVFGGVELVYLSGNLVKVASGGWLPLLVAAGVFLVMTTWQRGRKIVTANRQQQEGSLQAFVDELHADGLTTVPGTAVFPHPTKDTAPLALRANVDHNHVRHEQIVIVSARAANVPYVDPPDRLHVDDLGYDDDGIYHLTVKYGFSEAPNIPRALARARDEGRLAAAVDVERASFFLSRASIRATPAPGMPRWRKAIFVALAHNAANPAEYFGLPADRTVVMGTHVDV